MPKKFIEPQTGRRRHKGTTIPLPFIHCIQSALMWNRLYLW